MKKRLSACFLSLAILSLAILSLAILSFGQVQKPKSRPNSHPLHKTAAAPRAQKPAELTVEQIVQLVQAGISEDLIIAKIRKNNKAMDLSTDQMIQLKKVNASDNIVKLLMDPQARLVPPPTSAAASQSQPAAQPAIHAEPKKEEPEPAKAEAKALPPAASLVPMKTATSYEELKQLLRERYDKQVLVAMTPLLAGEFKKGFISLGAGEAGLLWYHYHESIPIPDRKRSNPLKLWGKKTNEMDQLDARTFADLDKGLNISKIAKGESLKVHKFYIMQDFVEFNLVTISLGHLRDMDMHKASTETATSVSGNEVNQTVSVGGFGLRFRFFFDKEKTLKGADYPTIVKEINKYLLPKDEAAQVLSAEKNVEIDLGMSEEAVIQKLGQPLQSLRIGNQKSLKYRDMTIVLKDGKVSEVKL